MKIGVISDTHGFLDPRVEKIFAGVHHILHAGDIGYASIILELGMIAPTTAVLGNCDDTSIGFRLTEKPRLSEKKFLLHHIVNPRELSENLHAEIVKADPEVVVFGHTHKKFSERIGGRLFLNPGYSGKPKLGTERSVAILRWEAGEWHTQFIPL